MPTPNPKAAKLIRAINDLIHESLEAVAASVESGRVNFSGLIGVVDNIQEIVNLAQDD